MQAGRREQGWCLNQANSCRAGNQPHPGRAWSPWWHPGHSPRAGGTGRTGQLSRHSPQGAQLSGSSMPKLGWGQHQLLPQPPGDKPVLGTEMGRLALASPLPGITTVPCQSMESCQFRQSCQPGKGWGTARCSSTLPVLPLRYKSRRKAVPELYPFIAFSHAPSCLTGSKSGRMGPRTGLSL